MNLEEEVSLDSAEEVENLVGCGCKVSLMDLQREIFLKVHALKRERDHDRISLEEGSSSQPLRQGISSMAQLRQSRDKKIGMHLHPLKSIQNLRLN